MSTSFLWGVRSDQDKIIGVCPNHETEICCGRLAFWERIRHVERRLVFRALATSNLKALRRLVNV